MTGTISAVVGIKDWASPKDPTTANSTPTRFGQRTEPSASQPLPIDQNSLKAQFRLASETWLIKNIDDDSLLSR